MEAPILEGPRGQNPYHQASDLDQSIRWANWARRGLPIRPYLHARISRITVAEQLPQMMMMMMMMMMMIMMNITAAGAVDRELLYID